MSQLTMTIEETQQIDAQVGNMLTWAQNNTYEAEQLAMDASRLLSCTSDRLNKLSNQGFFKRCWSHFSGEVISADRANVADLAQMQKMSLRYIGMLQEEKLMMAHSMLAMKNNLLSLAIKEEETRKLIALLAERTKARFDKLEHRVEQLETSTNLHGWLLSLEERDYNEKYPTEYIRLFRIVNDFYSIKNNDWNYQDLLFMRKAIRIVQINPKLQISLDVFIDNIIGEIDTPEIGISIYNDEITTFKPEHIENYHAFIVENISSPVFSTMHTLTVYYEDRRDMIEEFQEELNISTGEALKRLLKRTVRQQNINLNYEFPLAEAAIEILGCLRLVEHLSSNVGNNTSSTRTNKNEKITSAKNSRQGEKIYCKECGTKCEDDNVFCHKCGSKYFKYATRSSNINFL